jgi:DNA-binding CsgD family transcriptional regulator
MIELFESLSAVSSSDELLFELATFAGGLGFNQAVAFVTLTDPVSGKTVIHDVNNYSDKWKTSAYDEKLWSRDPVIDHMRARLTPLVWNRDTYIRAAAADIWDNASSYGFHAGIAISIRDQLGHGYKVGFSTDQDLKLPGHELSRIVAEAQLFATFAQNAMQRLWVNRQTRSFEELTPREIECLRWTVDGKTAQDIGLILGISDRTANYHLGNAIRKLECENKVGAVFRAMRLGLIR